MIYKAKRLAWKATRFCLAKVGIYAVLRQPDYHYVPDYYGRSAHKHIDIRGLPGFGDLASEVIQQGKTLLYYDRLYVIYQALINLKAIAEQRFGCLNLAEVGVYQGGSSYFIASVLEALCLDAAMLHCFDTFEGHPAEDISPQADPFHRQGLFSDTQIAAVRTYLERFGNITLHKGRFQDTCVHVASYQFHFVHLDVDLYEPTRFGLSFFDERLVTGGIVVVDDYGFHTCPGVKQAVDEFRRAKDNYFSLHLLSGQCILVKMGEPGCRKPG